MVRNSLETAIPVRVRLSSPASQDVTSTRPHSQPQQHLFLPMPEIFFPQELWEQIAIDLDVRGIGSLRLTCKSLHVILRPAFLKFFVNRKVALFSQDSLRRLVCVTEHEVFGPLVKSITILAVFYDTAKVDGMLASGRRRLAGTRVFDGAPCSEEEIREATLNSEFLHRRRADQERIREEGTHKNLLMEAFQNLGSLTILSFDLVIYNRMDTKVFGSVEMESREKLAGFILETFEVGLSAAIGSGLSLQALNIFGEGSRGGLSLTFDLQDAINRLGRREGNHRRVYQYGRSDNLPSVLKQVRSFKYSLVQESVSFSPLELLSLINFQNLEDLFIAFNVTEEVFDEPFMDRLSSLDFARLRTFTLDKVSISQRPFLRFLKTNATLEKLTLRSVTLLGTWKPILKYCCGTPENDAREHIPHPGLKDIISIPSSEILLHPNLRTLVLEYIQEFTPGSKKQADKIRFLSRNSVSIEDYSSKVQLQNEELTKGILYTVYAGRQRPAWYQDTLYIEEV
ncbi:hypothetical protein M422DRAFT_41667 [Sphaerobolus stellatus SS14]|nr:hypothetical protein M422DRAFT_41667 [Sphaerobolus stellatus SS14]